MKKHLLILSLFLAVFASCSKDKDNFDPAAQAIKDEAAIQAYLTAHPEIDATKDEHGVYYQVVTVGTGANPTLTNTVSVNYAGRLLDGTQFEANNGVSFPLDGVIDGWKYGLQHVKAGGRILLIIPSGLAYGNRAKSGIPANSVLVFTIDLLTIK